MKMLAILAIRNEELYIKYCLNNLISQGFEVYIIDNDSDDNGVKIAKKYLNKGVVTIDKLNTGGVFDLAKMMEYKADIANNYVSDWFMHTDADEIRLPHPPFKTIKEALVTVESLGYNAVNFHLFNFMPVDDKSYINRDYEKEMLYYYFHSSEPFSQIKLWKNIGSKASFGVSGGHRVNFDGIKVYPNSFIIKHYMFLSKEHAIEKYSKQRKYLEENVKKYGWHGSMRTNFDRSKFSLPPRTKLKKLVGNDFDTSDPTPVHLFYRGQEGNTNQDDMSSKKQGESSSQEPVETNSIEKIERKRVSITIYKIILSLYRRTVPLRLRQKVKNILINTSNY